MVLSNTCVFMFKKFLIGLLVLPVLDGNMDANDKSRYGSNESIKCAMSTSTNENTFGKLSDSNSADHRHRGDAQRGIGPWRQGQRDPESVGSGHKSAAERRNGSDKQEHG